MSIDLGAIQFDDEIVLRQLKSDLKDDWFPDPRMFDDMFDQKIIQELISNNFSQNHGTYKPNKRSVLNVPKSNFTLRYGLEVSVSDRAFYHGLVSFLVPFFDPLIPWNVFSHRYTKKDNKYLFQRAVGAWSDFVGNIQATLTANPQAVLLSTDLANYFEHIDIEKLKEVMESLLPEVEATADEKGHIRSHLKTLFENLKEWCYTETSGLPQNRDASSFLANIYMLKVDSFMLELGYRYYRYMDDIKIICDDEFHARHALKRLSLQLRELGLSVNSKKTEICETPEKRLFNAYVR